MTLVTETPDQSAELIKPKWEYLSLPEHLPFGMCKKHKGRCKLDFLKNFNICYKKKMEEAEKLILLDAIEQSGGNKSVFAKALDISLRIMRYKIKKYNL